MNAVLAALWTKINTTSGAGFLFKLGGRAYLDLAPADTELPLCVYTVGTQRFERGYSGSTMHVMRAVFTIYDSADTTSGLNAAQDDLRTLLDNAVFSASGYDRISCVLKQRGSPSQDDDAWSVQEIYELRGQLTS